MNRFFAFILLLGFLFFPFSPGEVVNTRGQLVHHITSAFAAQMPEYPPMPAPGKNVSVGNGYYMIYNFDKKPKLGTAIMKVEVFTEDGKKDTSLEVKADADMPSMRGAHGTGNRVFKISNKGDYLLPIPIVMPGDWQVRFTVSKDGKVIFRGRYDFDV